ncbi:hypothetical protein ACEPPN_003864 [Leptodophora sp. 'Broadleaf-Isolate-01']
MSKLFAGSPISNEQQGEDEQKTYMTLIKKAEAVEMWNANLRASLLDPRVRAHLTAQLLVHTAGVMGFCELMGHSTTQNELLDRVWRLHLNRHTHIEAASYPLAFVGDGTGHMITETQMMFDDGTYGVPVSPELLVEGLGGWDVLRLYNEVIVCIESLTAGNGRAF